MSELKIEDLKKMSAKKLEEYIPHLEGEDKLLAEKVLASKASVKNVAKNDPAVKEAIERSKEMSEDKRAREAEREKLRLEKEAAKAKIEAEKEAKAAEREAARKKIAEAKEAAKKEREEKAEKRKAELLARKEAREKERKEKAEARAKLLAEKEAEKEAKEAEKIARAKEVAEKLKSLEGQEKPRTKTDAVRELIMQGLTNPEIAKATGYGIKFVCDTVWRLERQAEKYAAKQAEAEKYIEHTNEEIV